MCLKSDCVFRISKLLRFHKLLTELIFVALILYITLVLLANSYIDKIFNSFLVNFAFLLAKRSRFSIQVFHRRYIKVKKECNIYIYSYHV